MDTTDRRRMELIGDRKIAQDSVVVRRLSVRSEPRNWEGREGGGGA